ncbi:MAG TPA: hypothetical protein VJ372_12755 [Pyrinomonadaceae bacterium]|nr:hypothetical protein [Pyrinomonadaceae bacterium]
MKRKDFRNMRHGTHHNNSFRALSFAYLEAGSGRSPNSWFGFRLPRGRNRSSLLAQHHHVIAYSRRYIIGLMPCRLRMPLPASNSSVSSSDR